MNDVLKTMLKRYSCVTVNDYENALVEIVQEAALCGLWRAKFFEHAAFYGGTALRILYGLDRFSEDIDFTLLRQKAAFDLEKYIEPVQTELESLGFRVEVAKKDKSLQSDVDSAFIKADTLYHFISIETPKDIVAKTHKNKKLKIKFEVDKKPALGFKTEVKNILGPIPFSVLSLTLPDLFAGKVHALLCRAWKNRVKGRDWYDFVWYLSQGVPIGLAYLKNKLEQSGLASHAEILSPEKVKQLILSKIQTVDFDAAKRDVLPFIKDPASLKLWSANFFMDILSKLKVS